VAVFVGVRSALVGVAVRVGVLLGVAVFVGVRSALVGVAVRVGVLLGVAVFVGVRSALVGVAVRVGVLLGVAVGTDVCVGVAVGTLTTRRLSSVMAPEEKGKESCQEPPGRAHCARTPLT